MYTLYSSQVHFSAPAPPDANADASPSDPASLAWSMPLDKVSPSDLNAALQLIEAKAQEPGGTYGSALLYYSQHTDELGLPADPNDDTTDAQFQLRALITFSGLLLLKKMGEGASFDDQMLAVEAYSYGAVSHAQDVLRQSLESSANEQALDSASPFGPPDHRPLILIPGNLPDTPAIDAAKAAIDQITGDPELASSLAGVHNVSFEQQSAWGNHTDAINHEFDNGQGLPDGIRAKRDEIAALGDPVALDLLDSAILEEIRFQHPDITTVLNNLPNTPPLTPEQEAQIPTTAASLGLREVSFDEATQSYSVEVKFAPLQNRFSFNSNLLDTVSERMQSNADAMAVRDLGMPRASTDTLFSLRFTDADGRSLSVSAVPRDQLNSILNTDAEATLNRVYQQRLTEKAAAQQPKTPEDWAHLRRDAWAETMQSPEVASITQQLVDAGATLGSSPSDLSRVARDATRAGNDLLFNSAGGRSFAVIPRSIDDLGVDVTDIASKTDHFYAKKLDGTLARVYEEKMTEALAKLASPPTTQAEFDRIQDAAWEATLNDPAINHYLGRIQNANNEVRIAAADKAKADAANLSQEGKSAALQAALDLEVFSLLPEDSGARNGVFIRPRTIQNLSADSGTSANSIPLDVMLRGQDTTAYQQKRAELVSAHGEEAGKEFDRLVRQKIINEAQHIDALIAGVPDLLDLADGPNRAGTVITPEQQAKNSWDASTALDYSLEGKDASALQAVRDAIIDPRERAEFDRSVLAILQTESARNFAAFKFDASNLYLQGIPRMGDVNQGYESEGHATKGIGDCYLVAAIGALADKQPQAIMDAISYDDASQSFTVRLYINGETRYINVTQTDLQDNLARHGGSNIDDNTQHDGAAWPTVIETAIAKSKDSDESDGLDEGYAAIATPDVPLGVMKMITGRDADAYLPANISLGSTVTDILAGPLAPFFKGFDPELQDNLIGAYNYGDAIVVGTAPDNNVPGLLSQHAYMVGNIYTKDGDTYIDLVNPWGSNYDADGKELPRAPVTMKLSTLLEGNPMIFISHPTGPIDVGVVAAQ